MALGYLGLKIIRNDLLEHHTLREKTEEYLQIFFWKLF